MGPNSLMAVYVDFLGKGVRFRDSGLRFRACSLMGVFRVSPVVSNCINCSTKNRHAVR